MSTPPPTTDPRGTDTPRRSWMSSPWATLAAVSFGLFMVGLDSTVVHIANPAIQADLGATFADLQWVINSYLLALAALLILGGKLGDRFGRKRMYLAGVALFGISSVGIGLIGSIEGVIALRAVQGLSAALLMPQTVALLRATFPREKFGMAVGIWGGVSSVAIAAGPLVSGLIVAHLNWEWVFYINAPIAAIAIGFGAKVLSETDRVREGRFDLVGVVLLAGALCALVFGVVQGQSWGWTSTATLGTFILAAVLMAAFIVVESRIADPLLPLHLFRSAKVNAGGLVFVANFFAILGVTFLITLFLMNTLGHSTIGAGLMMLPLSAFSIPAAPIGAMLTARFGPRRIAALGLGLMGAALALLAFVDADSPYWHMALPFVVLAFGSGFAIPSGADLIVGGAPVHLAGVASGFQTTCIQLGGAVGTAVLSAVVASGISGTMNGLPLPDDAADAAAAGVPFEAFPQVNDAFVGGMQTGMVISAILAFVVAGLTLAFVKDGVRHDFETVAEETAEGSAAHI